MHRTTTTLLLAACLTLATGCGSSSDDKPTPTVTVTKTPALSAAQQRAACVDAWADAIDSGASSDDAPKACQKVPNSDQVSAYMEGLSKRNRRAQASFKACTDDPSSCPTEP
jgi:hypothetical protein